MTPEQHVPEAIIGVEEPYKFAPPVTARELLGSGLKDAQDLTLTTSPIHLAVVPDGRLGASNYLAVVEYPLESELLRRFLVSIAPSPDFGADRLGILADWQMPDLAARDFYSRRLLKRHQGRLRGDWSRFEKHRQLFISTLEKGHFSLENIKGRLRSTIQQDGGLLVFLLGNDTSNLDGLRSQFTGFLQSRHQFKKRKWVYEHPEQYYSRVLNWDSHVEKKLMDGFWQYLLKNAKRELAIAYARQKGLFLIGEDLGDETHYQYKGIEVQVRENGKVAVNYQNVVKAEAIWDGDIFGPEWVPESIKSANFLMPLVRWQKDLEGQRSWDFAFLEEPLPTEIKKIVGPLVEDLDFTTRRINPLVGFLSVAYLSSDLRANWPKELSLEPGGRRQPMGPAQVPVLALRYKKSLLGSRFFSQAEDYVSDVLS